MSKFGDFRAPCGHRGEPIIGTFVKCTEGCDGLPKAADPLLEDIKQSLARAPVPELRSWHLERPANGRVLVVIDDYLGKLEFHEARRTGAFESYTVSLIDRVPHSIAEKAWKFVKDETEKGRALPTFDLLAEFMDGFRRDGAKMGCSATGWDPASAAVTTDKYGRKLQVTVKTPKGDKTHVDYF